MSISVQTQSILLMTAHFGGAAKDDPRPLSPLEWGRFALWLKERDISPEALLTDDPARLLTGWVGGKVTLERIRYLLGRAAALGLALEKWQRAGLWVMTRSESDYPTRLKKHLSTGSPPVLFGCGSRNLLNRGGIAVVGSRNVDSDGLAFTARLGREAARQGLSVVSGGARGVDETAMLESLEWEGTAVGLVADSLLRMATSAKYRKALMSNNLVLTSPFSPEAGFDVGNAMARNKYIYCLSDAAVVVSSSRGKGGTWSGAIENLRRRWVPLWVKPDPDAESGNAELVRKGARWLPEGEPDLTTLFSADLSSRSGQLESLLLHGYSGAPGGTAGEAGSLYGETSPNSGWLREAMDHPQAVSLPNADANAIGDTSFYELFLVRLQRLAGMSAITADDLLDHLDVNRSQLNDWLKLAIDEGRVEKLNKPVRYRPTKNRPRQESMFGEDRRV